MKKVALILITVCFSQMAFANVCFHKHRVRGFSDAGRDSVVINAGSKSYLVKTVPCFELSFANAIDFRSHSSRICKGDSVLVLDNFSGRVKDRCMIKSISEI